MTYHPSSSEYELDRSGSHNHACTLIAIAKDEGRYLLEWIGYHLVVGFEKIIIYNNESADETRDLLENLSRKDKRVAYLDWPSSENESTQIEAYKHGVKTVSTPWVCALDIDEFIVPYEPAGIRGFLDTIPSDVSCIYINWLGFGSGGLTDPDYGLVTRTFKNCSKKSWSNNLHVKNICRTQYITKCHVHSFETSQGRHVLSDLTDCELESHGLSPRVVYSGIQINHYQCKTYSEFKSRMARGDANRSKYDPTRVRDDSMSRFLQLDINDEYDQTIELFDRGLEKMLSRLR